MLIGVDYGKKRVGLAVSDLGERLAFPHAVWENWQALSAVLKLAKERQARGVVIGASRDFKGVDNPVMLDIIKFAEALTAAGQKVFLEPEFFSSLEAQRGAGDPALEDASAAAIILQSYLDKQKK